MRSLTPCGSVQCLQIPLTWPKLYACWQKIQLLVGNVMPLSAQYVRPVSCTRGTKFAVCEVTNRVNCVALTPFRVKVSLSLNIFKMLKVKSEAFSTKQLASINFVLFSSGKTKFSMASCEWIFFLCSNDFCLSNSPKWSNSSPMKK